MVGALIFTSTVAPLVTVTVVMTASAAELKTTALAVEAEQGSETTTLNAI